MLRLGARFPDCKTSYRFKGIPVIDAPLTPTTTTSHPNASDRIQPTTSDTLKPKPANLLFYGPYYIQRKFAREDFSIIAHSGVDRTRPVEHTDL